LALAARRLWRSSAGMALTHLDASAAGRPDRAAGVTTGDAVPRYRWLAPEPRNCQRLRMAGLALGLIALLTLFGSCLEAAPHGPLQRLPVQGLLLCMALAGWAFWASLPAGAIHIGINDDGVALVDHRHCLQQAPRRALWRCGPALGLGPLCIPAAAPVSRLFSPAAAREIEGLRGQAQRLPWHALLRVLWQSRHPAALALLALPPLLLWLGLLC